MAITFTEDLHFFSNAHVVVRLIDSNNADNEFSKCYPAHNHLNWVSLKKEQLTHKWENTIPTTWYPTIVFVDTTAGQQIFRSTVDCRVLDGDGKRDKDAELVIIANEKQRYITENGLTEE